MCENFVRCVCENFLSQWLVQSSCYKYDFRFMNEVPIEDWDQVRQSKNSTEGYFVFHQFLIIFSISKCAEKRTFYFVITCSFHFMKEALMEDWGHLRAFFCLCPHRIVFGLSNYMNLLSFMLVSYLHDCY